MMFVTFSILAIGFQMMVASIGISGISFLFYIFGGICDGSLEGMM